MKVLLLLCVLPMVFAADWEKPAFCNNLDCPIYTVVEEKPGYEFRHYERSTWVSTTDMGMTWEEATSGLFNKLFRYIQGNNDADRIIEMTAPVTTRVVPATGAGQPSNFTMSFYLPYEWQAAPPAPSDSSVFIEVKDEAKYYVTAFGGYASSTDYINAATALAEALGDSTLYRQDHFYSAGYNSPYQPFFRHNEAWLVSNQ